MIGITLLELLVAAIQAYVFALLTSRLPQRRRQPALSFLIST